VSISRQQLHALVDLVEEAGLATLYDVMIRFIPEDEAAPDEIEAIEQARAEYARGEVVRLEDFAAIQAADEDARYGRTVKHEDIDWN
jgi:hypothetical protein